jgi:chromosome segregation ATPase
MVTLPEISSKIITLIQARQLLQDKLATLDKIISGPTPDEAGMVERQKQLAALDIKHSDITRIINDLHNKMATLRNTKQQCLLDQALIKQITDEITISNKLLMPDIELLFTTNTKQQAEINSQIELSSKISHIINERNILQAKQDKLIKLGQRRTDLLKMKELAIQCECQQLSVTVDSLNNAIGAIAVYLFDSPITIKINLFKTFKTTQRIKPTVNVTVNYKGNDYDSLNGLSGGERDRISLCVTLAMNRISGCPLLFLDEVIGTLDAGLTETAIKSIKVSTTGKTCLLVSHSAVEGVFRDVIQFT